MVGKLFRKMLPSQILSNLAMAVCMQVDIVLIGQFLGVEGVSAYGFVNPVLITITAFSGLISVGIATVCSMFVGRGDRKGINVNFSSNMLFSLAISAVTTLVIFLLCNPLVSLLGAEPGTSTFVASADYLKGYGIGIPFYIFMTALTSYLHLAGKRKLVITSIVVMTVLDIGLDIFNGAILHWGMFGMGLATAISEIGGFVVVLIYFLKKSSMFSLDIKTVSRKHIGMTVLSGTPYAFNNICYMLSVFFMNHLLLKYGGTGAVAVYSVISSLATICATTNAGVGGTTQFLTGIFFGENDKDNIVKSMNTGLLWGLILDAFLVVVVLVFKNPLAALYVTDDPEVLKLTVAALSIYVFALIPGGLVLLFRNYYSVRGKVGLAVITSLGENALFNIGFAIILSAVFGVYGIFAAPVVSDFVSVGLIGVLTWIVNKKFPKKIEDLYILPKGLTDENAQVIGFQIKRDEDVTEVSQAARAYCIEKGSSKKLSMYIALCIEEMACEIISRGFKEKKDNLIEVRMVFTNGAWIIRIKDNCDDFDPVNYMKLHEAEDDISHLGIRMVFKMVTDARYINSLGLNCLTMKLEAEK